MSTEPLGQSTLFPKESESGQQIWDISLEPWTGVGCRRGESLRKVSSVSYHTSTLIFDCLFLETALGKKMANKEYANVTQALRVCCLAVLSVLSLLQRCPFLYLHLHAILVTVNSGQLWFKYLSSLGAKRNYHHSYLCSFHFQKQFLYKYFHSEN